MEKKFEDCMEELSSVVSQMQKEEIPLEEMLVQYKKGDRSGNGLSYYIEGNRERYT